MLTELYLKNFMAFDEITIDLSSKVNVIIGENGTGKTQLMKAAYAMLEYANLIASEINRTDILNTHIENLLKLFKPLDNEINALRERKAQMLAEDLIMCINGNFDDEVFKAAVEFKIGLEPEIPKEDIDVYFDYEAIFIPAKESMTFLKTLMSEDADSKTINDLFDLTYTKLADSIKSNPITKDEIEEKIKKDIRFANIYLELVKEMGGMYHLHNDEIIFTPGYYKPDKKYEDDGVTLGQLDDIPLAQWGDIPLSDLDYIALDENGEPLLHDGKIYIDFRNYTFHELEYSQDMSISTTAEGFRKLGILQLLLLNQSFLSESISVVFIDEPEANLNPKLMELAVKVLLELAKNGVKVITTTHDYNILNWFSLLSNENERDEIMYHSLYRDKIADEIKVSSTNKYSKIEPNAIDEAFETIVEAEVDKDIQDIMNSLEEDDNA